MLPHISATWSRFGPFTSGHGQGVLVVASYLLSRPAHTERAVSVPKKMSMSTEKWNRAHATHSALGKTRPARRSRLGPTPFGSDIVFTGLFPPLFFHVSASALRFI